MKQVHGYNIIASARMTDGKVIVLGARLNNWHSDDYSYVVATLDNDNATSWPSGKYFRTLPLAVQWHNEDIQNHMPVVAGRVVR